MGWSQICMYLCYFIALICFVVGCWPKKEFPKKAKHVIRRRGTFHDA